MQIVDSFAKAEEYAKLAFATMKQRGIPATPQNYTLWYDYVSDKNPELKMALDAILDQEGSFSPEICQQLFQKFYQIEGNHSDEIHQVGLKLQSTMKQVMEQIGVAGSDSENYGEKIASLATDIASEDNVASLKSFVEEIVLETAAITEKNKALQNQLQQSSQEISKLQQNLDRVKAESLTDALTQIGNRKLFDAKLMQEAGNASAEGTELCLLLMDIDHFKKFNDTYGHRIGDEVLKVVGKKLVEAVKGQDTPARYGGEEFACILPDTTLEDAAELADQIREKISKQVLKNKKTGQEFGRITLSIGVSRYVLGEALENLVQRADEALYRAKNQGRNKVIKEIS
ncbi:GGDEF domain-containing protein [Kiloniella laminariae]|uniref:GGDEF domain-containing protein n=1 Tax=Kiloniella laminariae TaxID=454162 RepID=UPI0003817BD6|nr:GGDEF domain-containing protein [Kiloniella laminariae]